MKEKTRFKIVKGTVKHIEEIASLFNEYRKFYAKESDLALAKTFISERIQNNESSILICIDEDKDEVVGFTQIYPTFSSVSCGKDYILNDLFVIPEYIKKGVATLILEEAKRFVIKNQGKGLMLETAKNNPARALYEKLGWHADEDFIHYYWMEK